MSAPADLDMILVVFAATTVTLVPGRWAERPTDDRLPRQPAARGMVRGNASG
jgi:hypothetical protein